MPSEFIHAQHAAQLSFLQGYLDQRGWATEFLERGGDLPLNLLSVAAPRDPNGRERKITFAYVPLDDEDLDHIALLQFFSPLPIKLNLEYTRELDALLNVVNPGLAIGNFGHKDNEIFMRHIYTTPQTEMIDEEMFIESVLLFFSLQSATSPAIEAVATGKQTVVQALKQLQLVSENAPQRPKSSSETPLLDHAKAYFKKAGWEYEPVLNSAITAVFGGQNESYRCYIQAREADHQFIFYSVCPIKAPEDKFGDIMHFMTRANYGMYLGNFELDLDDGEIRFKTSIAFGEETVSDALIAPIIFPNVIAMDGYFPAIRAIIEEDADVEDVITKTENS